MKDIKFRAWETISKSMMNWKELLPHIGRILNAPKQTNVILMQYTGLKDKNGIEIYEGDILKRVVDKYIGTNLDTATNHMTKKAEISVVEYKGSCFSAFNNILHRVGKCEVIGNLYENPFLIDKSTINK